MISKVRKYFVIVSFWLYKKKSGHRGAGDRVLVIIGRVIEEEDVWNETSEQTHRAPQQGR